MCLVCVQQGGEGLQAAAAAISGGQARLHEYVPLPEADDDHDEDGFLEEF